MAQAKLECISLRKRIIKRRKKERTGQTEGWQADVRSLVPSGRYGA